LFIGHKRGRDWFPSPRKAKRNKWTARLKANGIFCFSTRGCGVRLEKLRFGVIHILRPSLRISGTILSFAWRLI
jgi:hypothetical protein